MSSTYSISFRSPRHPIGRPICLRTPARAATVLLVLVVGVGSAIAGGAQSLMWPVRNLDRARKRVGNAGRDDGIWRDPTTKMGSWR